METPPSELSVQDWLATTGIDWATKIVLALAIFIIGRIVVKILTGLILKAFKKAKVDDTLAGFLTKIANVLMLAVVVMAALEKLGVETTSLVAILGAAGLAVGLALQGSLSNFAAGVMIIIFRPFTVGNFIEAGGTKGIVEGISIFNTNMRTPQNQVVIVPNGQIMGGTIVNYSVKDTRRIDLTLGVSYDDDLRVAKDTINRVIAEDERILKDPAPIVGVMELGSSSVDIVAWFWVNSPDFLQTKMDTTEKMKVELEKAGCSIPYPQRDVHLYQSESKSA
ncbi:mechanosensitive ion channel family protein [Actomonas aquatica]|uniref:Mechanosensitive ion channel n=1 Tax=Actomonas aquatica TaxID=2866162 RepID=A0ABZ1CDH3_9BACT|nr:mechanosensitive ion channel domain-containing protein [Opitutus sp. WL0086]WRQ88350.1 mechanosensitive ion channel [Opitutus sp. WL0086]